MRDDSQNYFIYNCLFCCKLLRTYTIQLQKLFENLGAAPPY
jgi:hypothetical protein